MSSIEMQPSKDGLVSIDPVSPPAADGNVQEKSISHAYGGASRQEGLTLRRLFSFTQLFAFALTFMSSWEVMAMNMGATFYNGGPQTLVWGILPVVIGALTQAFSMAELAAIQPIAGAQYHWTYLLAPESHGRFITWMQGWVTWFAWVSALAGSTSSEANILLGLVSTNYPSYEFQSWHLTLLIIAQLVTVGLMNMYAFRSIPWLELAAGILHVILWFVFVIVLVALAPRHQPDFVFFERSTNSGWQNSFVEWNLGLLVPAWGFIGFDGVVHMSEEVRKAKKAVPRAMIWTILINGVLAYGMILVLLFCMGNPDEVLKSAYPIIPICFNAVGPGFGTAMVVGLLVITFCVVAASLASVSRITWAWARDGALPVWIAKVDPRHRVPIRSLWLPIGIVGLLSLFTLGNTNTSTVFSAFTALSSLGLYSSYIIAITCMLHARLTGRIGKEPENPEQDGNWKLPRQVRVATKMAINVCALLWTIYLTIWLPFPTTLPVTATNMNYAGPIFVFVVTAAIMSWFAWGRTRWAGLNTAAINMVERED